MRSVIATLITLVILSGGIGQAQPLPDTLRLRYEAVAQRILKTALADSSAFERLAYLVDTFGPRFSGTPQLERAIDWVLEAMRQDGLENVRGDTVMVPRWVRGNEALELRHPYRKKLAVLGLGGSVATPPEGIEAEVLVVRSFDELEARRDEARGRIVVFNVPFTTYGETVRYRVLGAVAAARAGAVASLVRSVTPHSLYTPHTGGMRYEDGVPRIPHAALTVEDAELLQRLQDRGQRPRLWLYMEAQTLPDVPSRNVVAELVGRERPEEIVVVGGHIDSWDVGQGAMDDAGGCVAAWEAVRLLKRLGLRPRRTIRVVLWTNEENGLRGALAYRDRYRDELDRHVLAIETDAGVFKPEGFGFTGSPEALAVVRAVARLLAPIEADRIWEGGGGADIAPLMREGVPGMGLRVDGTHYFWYHHTDADTIDKLDPHELNLCIAALAVIAYVIADLPEPLPRAAGG
ncbi:peptidase M28 [Rhodothermus marinus SG0.5JP17-172]|uniref:M28 family metallopeptidase n=1 Tax=Rhodothermus marinus TaxID=29549 RepID=UPI000223D85B|nr:M28 family metallopeptidase [Rhodothermus marinus]AEN73397.1 peptidase M28 [Rhodothermus marinus SG0.5JP17-172]